MAAADAEDDDVPCAYCSRQRALLHCAQHGARLCLPCDLRLHAAAAAPGRGHERAPLCDRCHAAPAAARCVDHRHQALLCAPCARAAGCDADGHATRPAQAYTGCPGPAELARILSWDAAAAPPPLPEPPDTWVPDLVNIELLPDLLPSSSSSWHDGNITSELLSGSLMETGGNFEGPVAGSSGASLPTGDGDDELFIDEDWPNLDDAGLDDFNFILDDSNNLTMNSINLTDQREGTFKPQASTSLGYDHPLIASCSEPIIAASIDAVLESLASNNAAYHQFSSVATANMSGNVSSELLPHGNTFYASGMAPTMLPGDEFPSTNFGFEVKPPALVAAVSSPIGSYQDQEAALLVLSAHEQQASSHDMEARTKQQEKRQEAKQRYKDKKKNRRFGKQIMYVSRKVRADTRNRVKGRFAKASSGNDIQADDQSTQHGDDQPTN